MRQVRTRHWACGTEVVEPVPEGYDLSEGLALVCPRCRDAWWYYPEPEPEPEPALATVPAGPPAGVAEVQVPTAVATRPDVADAEVLGPPAARRDRPPRGAWGVGVRDVNGLVRVGLGVLMLAGIAVLVLALADAGPLRDEPAPSSRVAAPDRPPSPSRPALEAPATVRVDGRGFSLERPREWTAYRRGSALVVAPGPRAPVSLRVFSSRRPDLSLPRMAQLSAAALRSRLRGASVRGPVRVRIAGRPGLRVSATRAPMVRRITVVAAGARRYAVEVRLSRGATAAHRSAVEAIERSLRVRG